MNLIDRIITPRPAGFRVEKNTYIKEKVADRARRIEIEIGDEKEPDRFIPQLKTKHWDNEANFSVRLVDDDFDSGTVRTVSYKVEWERAGRKARLYEKDTGDEDGGFEFEVELAARPASNVLRFSITTKEFDFFYQPPLTPEEVEQGAVRPENVAGSYAVYHKTRKSNRAVEIAADKYTEAERDELVRQGKVFGKTDPKKPTRWYEVQKAYRTGKAFHIYRPYAEDATGKRVWCELLIDEKAGELAVVTPEEFLANAVYPVLIDPTFGYTSMGGSSTSFADGGSSDDEDHNFTSFNAVEDGTLDSVTAALKVNQSNDRTVPTVFAVYDKDSDGTDAHGLVAYQNDNITVLGSSIYNNFRWETLNFASESFSSGDKLLYIIGDGSGAEGGIYQIAYDNATTYSNSTFNVEAYSIPPSDPLNLGDNTDKRLSIYATYTAAPSSTEIDDERAVELTGSEVAIDGRSATVSGQDSANVVRSAEVHGSQSGSAARSAELTGDSPINLTATQEGAGNKLTWTYNP